MEKFNDLTKEQRQMLVGMLVNHCTNGENKPEIGQVVLAHSKLILSMIIKQAKLMTKVEALEEEVKKLKNNE